MSLKVTGTLTITTLTHLYDGEVNVHDFTSWNEAIEYAFNNINSLTEEDLEELENDGDVNTDSGERVQVDPMMVEAALADESLRERLRALPHPSIPGKTRLDWVEFCTSTWSYLPVAKFLKTL